MSNYPEAFFKVGKKVFLLDYWGSRSGHRALAVAGDIYAVDRNLNIFTACIFGDTYQNYRFEDYGRLIFPTFKEACDMANKLPIPQSVVHLLRSGRIYKKTVVGVRGVELNGIWDMAIFFDKGNFVSTYELGKTLFYTREDAEKFKKK